jgi:hypothetical protein
VFNASLQWFAATWRHVELEACKGLNDFTKLAKKISNRKFILLFYCYFVYVFLLVYNSQQDW